MLLRIIFKSMWDRRLVVGLTIASLTISTWVLLGVEHLRQETRHSFSKTVSDTDLIVGARTGQVNLLLYSVFRIGNATNNIRWQSYQDVAALGDVAWTIPLSLGDAHRGYRVLGTDLNYFEYFRYGNGQPLELAQGRAFELPDAPGESNVRLEAVLGAEVARQLKYTLEQTLRVSHGTGTVSFTHHSQHPFTVVGILAPTGTPVDQTVHVSLSSLEVIHGQTQRLEPASITAFMTGLDSRMTTFRLQRMINEYPHEPLLAILPGVALSELWQMMGILERVLTLITLLVLISTLLGMMTMILATLQQRAREIAVLRATGANPWFIFRLIIGEALFMTVAGTGLGLVALLLSLQFLAPWIASTWGIFVSANPLSSTALLYLTAILAAGLCLSVLPAGFAYRQSLVTRLSR